MLLEKGGGKGRKTVLSGVRAAFAGRKYQVTRPSGCEKSKGKK